MKNDEWQPKVEPEITDPQAPASEGAESQPGEAEFAALQIGEMEAMEMAVDWYASAGGYDPDFLGPRVDLPALSPEQSADTVPLSDGSGQELRYTHFSVVMCKSRQLAYFTAVNIDGENLQKLPRKGDKWYFDPRIPKQDQMGPPVYKHPDLDRGHLVRRLDPVWGEAAVQANEDTFHFTNCSPQHSRLNQRTWLGLEDYIFERARQQQFKVTVFTGPVFRSTDPLYQERYRIPEEFWKVAVMVKDDGALSATAYVQSQRDLVSDLEAEAYGQYQTYQVPVAEIEALTGLDFGALREHDPLRPGELEAEAPVRLIVGLEDLVL